MATELDDIFDQSIDRYLNGEMSAEEQQAFRSSVASDPMRQKLLDAEQVVRRVAFEDVPPTTPDAVPSPVLLEYLRTTPAKRLWSPGMFMTVVALVAFLALISYFIFQSQRTVIRESSNTNPPTHQTVVVDSPSAPLATPPTPQDVAGGKKADVKNSEPTKPEEPESDLDAHLNKAPVIVRDTMRGH